MAKGRLAAAILIAGVLDILSAFVFAGMNGASPGSVLAVIATGPFGAGIAPSPWAPAIGLTVHFAIMSVMVIVFALAARRFPEPMAKAGPLVAGFAYGVILYLVMYWVVLPLRWPEVHPQFEAMRIAKALFAHTICTGLPIALILLPFRRSATGAAHADTQAPGAVPHQ